MQSVTCHCNSIPTPVACIPQRSRATGVADLSWLGKSEMTGNSATDHPTANGKACQHQCTHASAPRAPAENLSHHQKPSSARNHQCTSCSPVMLWSRPQHLPWATPRSAGSTDACAKAPDPVAPKPLVDLNSDRCRTIAAIEVFETINLRQAARVVPKQGQQLHAVLVVQRCCAAVGPRRQQPRAVWAAGHAGHDACAAAPQPVSPAFVLLPGGGCWIGLCLFPSFAEQPLA